MMKIRFFVLFHALSLCLLHVLVFSASGFAQSSESPRSQSVTKSITSVLDADGTIRPGTSGSFSNDGSVRMSVGPDGKPRFGPSTAIASGCNDGWDDRFYSNGPDGSISAIAVDSEGAIYIAGSFTSIGNKAANRIAKWNGIAWEALGSGLDGNVNTLAVSGTDLYAGGFFTSAGGLTVNNIAKWDGSTWSALGGGTNDRVSEIVISGGTVYAGGIFTSAGGVAANRIASWDGSTWSALGAGVNGEILSLAILGNDLYAGGTFLQAGGQPADYIAKWNGTAWSTVGTGMNFYVFELVVSGTDLYAAGRFTVAGGVAANRIAKWNGSSWSALGAGLDGDGYAIAVIGSDMYVGGNFLNAGGVQSRSIAKWNGSEWSSVDAGVNGVVLALEKVGEDLYVGGYFDSAGSVGVKDLAKWDGTSWSNPAQGDGAGLNGRVNAIAVAGNEVYVGGYFTTAGSTAASYIAKWNGMNWTSLGSGLNGPVFDIAVSGNDVYAVGSFSTAGGSPANNIAKWDGAAWSSLDTGLNGSGQAVTVSGSEIYVAGSFSQAGGEFALRLAKWNGTVWSAVGEGSGPDGPINSLAVSGSDLYAGGDFTNTGGQPIAYLAKWNGTSWSALGSGLGGPVRSIAISGTDIYAAVSETFSRSIQKWNGSNWSNIGTMDGSAGKIVVSGSDVFVAGAFSNIAGTAARSISKWNGASWSPLGAGLNGEVWALAVSGGRVYAGGQFTSAGCSSSAHFGVYESQFWQGDESDDWHSEGNWNSGIIPPSGTSLNLGPNSVAIRSADVVVGDLSLNGGMTLTVEAGRTLTITGTLNLAGGTIAGDGLVIVENCDPGSITGASASRFVAASLKRCVTDSGSFMFPVGSSGVYAPVRLDNIVGSGDFTVKPHSGAHSALNLPAYSLMRWWELTNDGLTRANVTFTYNDSEVVGNINNYRAYRINDGVAQGISTTIDTTAKTATVENVDQFSPWTLGQIAGPTAASVPVAGRVRTVGGRGIGNAVVTISDEHGNVRTARTSSFGYYRFDDVMTGRAYVLQVTAKRMQFAETQILLNVSDAVSTADFVALEVQ